jgi:RNA polymerase sigma-70 factor (ECF subfamily)
MREGTLTEVERLSRASGTDEALDLDQEAFQAFYHRTSRALWGYLSRISGDRQLADDLLQETYYRLLRSGRTFDSEEHRRHYLFRIATNLVLDGRRQPRLRLTHMPGECDAASPRTGDTGEQAVRRADLSRAMNRMKPRDRALLWLAYAQGSSHLEIAAMTGVKIGSVKLMLFRARHRLARLMRGRS